MRTLGLMNGGIIFFKTTNLKDVSRYYRETIGCELWLDQGGCHIFKYGNMLFGLCQRDSADLCGMVTFVYPDRDGVDRMYAKVKVRAESEPRENEEYRIYHFFAKDPDGRTVEFQYFWDSLSP